MTSRFHIFYTLIAAALTPVSAHAGINKTACTLNGYPLFGKVQVVESFPDLKVQVVTSFPDLKVQQVGSFPDECGKWQMVDSFPDVKIQYVDSLPDIKVQFVSSFPGLQ